MENYVDEKQKHTILIADDLEVNRKILQSILANDYEIDEAENGLDALHMIREHGERYSLIILDNHMDKMTGLEVLEYISKNPWLKKLPVIMISADSNSEFVDRAYELGAADFFFVPFVPAIIRHRVKYTLDNYQQHKKELYNTVHREGELYFVMMQMDLEHDTCEITDTSESADMWDKEIGLCASETIRVFMEFGYIHPDDKAEFWKFINPKNLQVKFLDGAIKVHFRYRRKYKDEYRWALIEVARTMDYSKDRQTVVVVSRDIHEDVKNQNKALGIIAEHAISTDYCNITRDIFYHDEKASYIDPIVQRFDTITQMLEWGAGKIQLATMKEGFLKTFSRKSLITAFENGQKTISYKHAYYSKEVGHKLFRTSVQMFRNNYTKDIEAIYYIEDITDDFIRERIEDTLYDKEYMFIGVWDIVNEEIYIHRTAEGLYGDHDGTRVPYKDTTDYRSVRQSLPQEEYMKKTSAEYVKKQLEKADTYSYTVDVVAENGHPYTMEYVYRYFEKKTDMISVLIRDITESVERDMVTKGKNQKGFIRETEWFLSGHKKEDYAILYFDIKEFKAINELFGIEEGNKLLRFVCNILMQSSLQPVYTARLMADQFVCLALRSNVCDEALSRLCRIEIYDQEMPLVLRMHCGIYDIAESDQSVQWMCDKAKIALSYIENEFTNPYVRFEASMNSRYLNHLQVVNNIDGALGNNEFIVYYQPVYDAKTRQLVSAEALVRWKHEHEMISPGIFIPALEEKGIISKLDAYVTSAVDRFLKERYANALPYVPVSINLSRKDFYNTPMLKTLIELVADSPIEKKYYRFEITESSFANINNLNEWALQEFRSMGNKILVDDFGTGFSSLANVAEQEFDLLKIDMSFVKAIGKNPKTEAVIQSIIDMTHRMGAQVVAEGVEYQEQYEFLRDNGCDYIQGYYFYKPMSEQEFETILDKEM